MGVLYDLNDLLIFLTSVSSVCRGKVAVIFSVIRPKSGAYGTPSPKDGEVRVLPVCYAYARLSLWRGDKLVFMAHPHSLALASKSTKSRRRIFTR